MADFNALPALAGKPADLSGLNVDMGNIFSTVEKIKAMRNQNSLFPMEREVLEGKLQSQSIKNQFDQVALEQMKQGAAYDKVARGVSALDPDNPVESSKEWDALMETFPEGKQWIGKYTADNVNKFSQIYSQQAAQSGQKAKAAAGIGNAFAIAESQKADIAKEGKEKAKQFVTDFDRVDDEVKQLSKAGKNVEQVWKDLAGRDPKFKENYGSTFDAKKLKAAIDGVESMRPQVEQYRMSNNLGLKPERDKQQIVNPGGGVVVAVDPFDPEAIHQIYKAPPSPHEANQDAIARRKQDLDEKKFEFLKGGGSASSVDDWADRVLNGTPLTAVPSALRTAVNSKVAAGERERTRVPGTTGVPDIDMEAEGYTTKPVPGAGGLTQAGIDQGAVVFKLTGKMPPGMGLGSGGEAGQRKTAIENRSGEIAPGSNLVANEAQVAALRKSMADQTVTLNRVERSVRTADAGFQQVIDKFKGKINNYDMPLMNIINNAAQYQLKPGDLAAAKAGLQEVANEYQQVFARNGQVTDQVRRTSQEIVDGHLSMNDLGKVMDELQEQGKIVRKSGADQVNKLLGQFGLNTIGKETPINDEEKKSDLPQGISEEDLQHTMKVRNLSREEVLNRLKARK